LGFFKVRNTKFPLPFLFWAPQRRNWPDFGVAGGGGMCMLVPPFEPSQDL
jgi:hypothetical protein